MNVDNIMPNVRGVAAAHARAAGCRAPFCRTMEAIDQVVKIEAFEEDNVEMGNSRINASTVIDAEPASRLDAGRRTETSGHRPAPAGGVAPRPRSHPWTSPDAQPS